MCIHVDNNVLIAMLVRFHAVVDMLLACLDALQPLLCCAGCFGVKKKMHMLDTRNVLLANFIFATDHEFSAYSSGILQLSKVRKPTDKILECYPDGPPVASIIMPVTLRRGDKPDKVMVGGKMAGLIAVNG